MPNSIFKSFSTIRLCSENVKASRDFYTRLFDQAPIEDLENFVSFRIAGVCLDIALADAKSPTSHGGAVGYWLVDDLKTVIEKSKALGAEIYRGPLKVNEAQRTIVQIIDPIGNVIGFEAPF